MSEYDYCTYVFKTCSQVGRAAWVDVTGKISGKEIVNLVYPETSLSDEQKIEKFIEEYEAYLK